MTTLTMIQALAELQTLTNPTVQQIRDIVVQVKASAPVNVDSAPVNGSLYLYSGGVGSKAGFEIVEDIVKPDELNVKKGYWIEDTQVGMLLTDNSSGGFLEILDSAIISDPDNTLSREAILDGTTTDGVRDNNGLWDSASANLADSASGNVLAIVGEPKPDSVFIQTEIPALLDNTNVNTINGLDRELLSAEFNAGRTDLIVNKLEVITQSFLYNATASDLGGDLDGKTILGITNDVEAEAFLKTLGDDAERYLPELDVTDGGGGSLLSNILELGEKIGKALLVTSFAIAFSRSAEAYETGGADAAAEVMGNWAAEMTAGEIVATAAGGALVGLLAVTVGVGALPAIAVGGLVLVAGVAAELFFGEEISQFVDNLGLALNDDIDISVTINGEEQIITVNDYYYNNLHTYGNDSSFEIFDNTPNLITGDDTLVAFNGNGDHDVILANDQNNMILVGNGDDTVQAGGGDDTILVGEGDDVIDGGAGNDLLDFRGLDSGLSNDVAANLSTGQVEVEYIFDNDNLTIHNIEAVVTGSGDDMLVGNSGDNTLGGGAGSDTYLFNGAYDKDIVIDADGLGRIDIDGKTLSGEANLLGDGIWRLEDDDLGSYEVRALSDGSARLYKLLGNGTLDIANSITIEDFGAGDEKLGITLEGDGSEDVPEGAGTITISAVIESYGRPENTIFNGFYYDYSGVPDSNVDFSVSYAFSDLTDYQSLTSTTITVGGFSQTIDGLATSAGHGFQGLGYAGFIGVSFTAGLNGFGGDGPFLGGGTYVVENIQLYYSVPLYENKLIIDEVNYTTYFEVDFDNPIGGPSYTLGNVISSETKVSTVGVVTFTDTQDGTGESDALIAEEAGSLIDGAGGDDTIAGASGSDSLYGSDGNDSISGGDADDTLAGGTGDDLLSGDNGNDLLYAESGNDIVFAGAGDDTIIAGSGNGNDGYDGGEGIDQITFTSATQSITVHLGQGTATGTEIDTDILANIEDVLAGAGHDTIIGDAANNKLEGSDGSDSIHGSFGDDTLIGGDARDTLTGGADHDVLLGGNGNDVLNGGNDNDTLTGGSGTDWFNVRDGHDVITDYQFGDTLRFDYAGADYTIRSQQNLVEFVYLLNTDENQSSATIAGTTLTLDLGDGIDSLTLENLVDTQLTTAIDAAMAFSLDDNNSLTGTSGNDTIFAGAGEDSVFGSGGDDLLYGEQDSDLVHGGNGDDTILGGLARDTLTGGAGEDVIYGEDGNDVLNGGTGNDTLTGGESGDWFNVFDGHDLITDFTFNSDTANVIVDSTTTQIRTQQQLLDVITLLEADASTESHVSTDSADLALTFANGYALTLGGIIDNGITQEQIDGVTG